MHCIDLPSFPTVLIPHLSSSAFMHSTSLALALSGHYCTSELHSAIFMHFTDLPLTLNRAFEFYSGVFVHCTDLAIIVSSYRCPSKRQSCLLCIPPTLLLPSTVIFACQSSILLVLCIPQTMLSLFRVISVHLSSSLLFFVLIFLCIP